LGFRLIAIGIAWVLFTFFQIGFPNIVLGIASIIVRRRI